MAPAVEPDCRQAQTSPDSTRTLRAVAISDLPSLRVQNTVNTDGRYATHYAITDLDGPIEQTGLDFAITVL